LINRVECISNIVAVREAIQNPDMAYVARTRLKRSILSCARLVAKCCECSEPELPGPFHPPENASRDLKEIVHICNRIYNSSSNLCQPSEPLEARWRDAWRILEIDLNNLESMLMSLPRLA
jgi:hypothetical protein